MNHHTEQAAIDPVIDMETFNSMKSMLEEAFDEIINDFINDSGEKVRQARQLLINNELDQLRDISHQLKSSSGSLGIMAFSRACNDIEESIRNQVITDLDNMVKEMENELSLALDTIRTLN